MKKDSRGVRCCSFHRSKEEDHSFDEKSFTSKRHIFSMLYIRFYVYEYVDKRPCFSSVQSLYGMGYETPGQTSKAT